jgi:hypothetical protein
MPTKNKVKKKQTKPKKSTARKKTPAKLTRKTAAKKAVKRKTPARKTAASVKGRKPAKRKLHSKPRTVEPQGYRVRRPQVRTASQSGDLQGLSRTQGADSESVAELLEEGNTFEAEAVTGVEAADNISEVQTHQVPEDDVPGEYLDEQ